MKGDKHHSTWHWRARRGSMPVGQHDIGMLGEHFTEYRYSSDWYLTARASTHQ